MNLCEVHIDEVLSVCNELVENEGNYGSRKLGSCCALGALAIAYEDKLKLEQGLNVLGSQYHDKWMEFLETPLSDYEVRMLGCREVNSASGYNAYRIITWINDNLSRECAVFIMENFLETKSE